MSFEPGDLLSERYRIGELLGRGGMAEVYAAMDEHEGRAVAIKVVDMLGDDPDHLAARMEREARVAARIESEHVCRLHGTGRDDHGALYLVLERLYGETLEQRLVREQRLDFGQVGAIVDQVLQGLIAAHAADVIHRDMKPSNIMLAIDPGGATKAKILDFGICRVDDSSASGWGEPVLTAEQSILGSIPYMAPEQSQSAAVDGRADVYGLAVIAFRMMTGRLPFMAQSPQAMMTLKVEHDAPVLADVTGFEWPTAIDYWMRTALNRDPSRRFTSEAAQAAWRTAYAAVSGWVPPAHFVLSDSNAAPMAVVTETLPNPRGGRGR